MRPWRNRAHGRNRQRTNSGANDKRWQTTIGNAHDRNEPRQRSYPNIDGRAFDDIHRMLARECGRGIHDRCVAERPTSLENEYKWLPDVHAHSRQRRDDGFRHDDE
jgi:hypothetical protein